MATIVTRITNPTGGTAKGSPLTSAEIDQNFINLNDNKLELTDLVSTNTADKGVKRDGSGGFSAGAIAASSLTLSTALAVAQGGTGATSASAARTALGLAIGTDVQAFDSDLSAVSGLSGTGIISRTGTGTASVRTITASTGISISNGDGVSGNPTITNTGVTSVNGQTGAVTAGAIGGGTDQVFYLNSVEITVDYTVPINKNAMTAGPVLINNGVTVTVSDGSTWTIV